MRTLDPSPATTAPPRLELRRAGPQDQEAIRRLLHATFVRELAQYPDDGSGLHRDKFERRHVCFLALEEGRLVGMVAVHGEAPFSVADRLPEGHTMEEQADRPLEVRLLCVVPGRRRSRIAFALMGVVFRFAQDHGHRELWISGVTRQMPLYRKLGFQAMGPSVPCGGSAFTPMKVPLKDLPTALVGRCLRDSAPAPLQPAATSQGTSSTPLLALLPGPPRMSPTTREAAASPPLYHRGQRFLRTYREVQARLRAWTPGHEVALFPGSGTLANDVVAAALRRLPEALERPGLILCNGEFSRRLRVHAQGADLPFRTLDFGWGRPWEIDRIRAEVEEADPAWVWTVQCESSTGMWHPVDELLSLLRLPGRPPVPLALDAISTLGLAPIPDGVAFASGVSGKALQALPGLAIVTSEPGTLERISSVPDPWPPSLDLVAHNEAVVPPHTLGFPVLAALHASLGRGAAAGSWEVRWRELKALQGWLHKRLTAVGVRILVPQAASSPAMTTFEVPSGLTTQEFLRLTASWGFALAGQSGYLRRRRLAQLATFGAFQKGEIEPLFAFWERWRAGTEESGRLGPLP